MKLFLTFAACALAVLIQSCAAVTATAPSKTGAGVCPPPLSDAEKRVLDRIGGEVLPDQNVRIGNITVHRREREISFPAKMWVTGGEEYGIEVLVALRNGRLHEALLVADIEPISLQIALYLLGAENGARLSGGEKMKQGTLLDIDVKPAGGARVPVEDWLIDKTTKNGMKRTGWVFVGSSYVFGMRCLAKEEGNIVNVWSCGNTILDNPGESADIKHVILVDEGKVPGRETDVEVFLSFRNQ